MKPRKIVLLVGREDERTSVLCFLLRTRGYAVVEASDLAEAERLIAEAPANRPLALLLVIWPFDGAAALIQQAKAEERQIHTLVVAPEEIRAAVDLPADVTLGRGFCSSAELLAAVKLLAARKRGPKPGLAPEAGSRPV